MKLLKTIGLVAAVVSMLGSASHLSAQAPYIPTLSVTTNGNIVTITWTGIVEAQGYNLVAGSASGLANIANVNLPLAVGRTIVVTAPSGIYFLRVRATAGSLAGPFSNEVQVNVNQVPCGTPAVPVIGTAVAGPNVTVSWAPIPGAIGYQVHYSRFAGASELVQTTGSNSHTQYVPLVGTFFVRVVAVSPCGASTSLEATFTIENLSGSGPRTPDPPPGQLLPVPSYGEAVMYETAARFPGDLANAGGSRMWLYRLVHELRKRDSRWGLNYKRGQYGDLSRDIVAYNPTNRPDNLESQIYLFDVVYQIDFANGPFWGDATHDTWSARGNPLCGTEWCAMWTLEPYIAAGFTP